MMEEKTFYLENQQTYQSKILNWRIPKTGKEVDLETLLTQLPNADKKSFKIFSPQKNEYVRISTLNPSLSFGLIPRQLLKMNVVIIKFSSNFKEKDSQEFSVSESENKKQRSRQRTIREVIELVEKWRKYHENPPDRRRKTLQQAAQHVGVSKKSLDDYYYQLRVAEKHDFDFTGHLEEKIGFLRAFLKQKEPERKAQGKNSKHPKTLKIIQQFSKRIKSLQSTSTVPKLSPASQPPSPTLPCILPSPPQLVPVTPCPQSLPVQQPHKDQPIDPFQSLQEQEQIFWGSPFTPLSQQKFMDCQKNFYNEFGFGDQESIDPYLPFTQLMNKKSYDSQLI